MPVREPGTLCRLDAITGDPVPKEMREDHRLAADLFLQLREVHARLLNSNEEINSSRREAASEALNSRSLIQCLTYGCGNIEPVENALVWLNEHNGRLDAYCSSCASQYGSSIRDERTRLTFDFVAEEYTFSFDGKEAAITDPTGKEVYRGLGVKINSLKASAASFLGVKPVIYYEFDLPASPPVISVP